jgi:hypothetical protein
MSYLEELKDMCEERKRNYIQELGKRGEGISQNNFKYYMNKHPELKDADDCIDFLYPMWIHYNKEKKTKIFWKLSNSREKAKLKCFGPCFVQNHYRLQYKKIYSYNCISIKISEEYVKK